MKDLIKQLRDSGWVSQNTGDQDDTPWQAADTLERMREALGMIARNTCCDNCQEAALVARQALQETKQ